MKNHLPEFTRLLEVIKSLRDPESGCPWDLKQTHQSLLKYLIEESYEFKEAVLNEDSKQMEEEIGDVLLQVLLHAQIASETNSFDIESVSKKLAEKMIRRHPHVFDNPKNENIETQQVIENWQKIKESEKVTSPYTFKSKHINLPSLTSSYVIGQKSSEINFDWENSDQVLDKVEEEFLEFKEEYSKKTEHMKEELGDLFFSLAQLSRHLDYDPEEVLKEANQKFVRRFSRLEDLLKEKNKELSSSTNEELENLWKIVKKSS